MEKLNTGIIRLLFWLINIAIAVIVIGSIWIGMMEGGTLSYIIKGDTIADRGFGPVTGVGNVIIAGMVMRLLYVIGLVYILVLLSRILNSILKGQLYQVWHLRYIRRIGILVLLAPLPALAVLVITSNAIPVAPVFSVIGAGLLSYLPYSVIGLVILAIAEVYKAGIAYKQEFDLTV
jgi:hypothetical protein